MSNNLFVRLKQILPPAPVWIGLVTAHHEEDDTSTVVLPTNEGTFEYAFGVSVGSTVRARGTTVPIGAKAFIRNGVIETRAPDGDPIEIEIGRVVPPMTPLVFDGPIADQAGTVGAAFTLDVSGYWSGGAGARVFSVAGGAALPAGLSLSSAGVISGTPTTGAVTPGVVLRATDAAGNRADSNAIEFDVVAAGVWAAVGAAGAAMSSPDGITWTSRTPAATGQWVAVAFGNGVFVAIRQSSTTNQIMTSPDGITWTSRSGASATNNWSSLAFGNGVFVAVRNSSTLGTQQVMTSPDGITWTLRTHASTRYLWSVAFGNGLFVALSYYGSNALTSPDGITWTSSAIPSDGWRSVAYSASLGMFAAVSEVAAGNNVMTSPDGVTWTRQTNPDSAEGWLSLCVGPGGMFVALTSPVASKTKTIRSTDGVTWTVSDNLPSPDTGVWQGVGYGGGTLVAVASGLGGGGGVTATSTDGVTWTAGSCPAGGNWFSPCWGTP